MLFDIASIVTEFEKDSSSKHVSRLHQSLQACLVDLFSRLSIEITHQKDFIELIVRAILPNDEIVLDDTI